MTVTKELQAIQKEVELYANLPYSVVVEKWDDGQGPYWVARVLELPGCMIHGDTPEEAVKEIEEVKREWIESNLRRGLKIPEPAPVPHQCSGKIILRMSPTLHEYLIRRAQLEGVSLNQYMITALARAAGYDEGRAGGTATES